MKHTARFLALILALATVTAFSLTFASAAEGEGGDITVEDAINGAVYNAYKILDFEMLDAAHGVYKLVPGTWTDFFNSDGVKNVYVTITDDTVAEASGHPDWAGFTKLASEWLKAHPTEPTATAAAGGETVKIHVDENGYYFVDTSSGAICSVTTFQPDSTIKEKNTKPKVEKTVHDDDKWDKDNDAYLGDIVEFEAKVIVGNGAENYKLTDVMTGLTYYTDNDHKLSVTLWVDDNHQSPVTEDNYTLTESENGFELIFKNEFLATLKISNRLNVRYYGKVKADAVIGGDGNDNTVTLKYGDNYSIDGGHDSTKTYVWEFNIHKFYKDGETVKDLDGAVFELHKGSADGEIVKFHHNGTVYTYDENADVTEIVAGTVSLQGLDSGIYYLVEVKAPENFNKLTSPVIVSIIPEDDAAHRGDVHKDLSEQAIENKTIEVENSTGALLPETGARGTKALVAIGSILVLVSVVFLVTKKKMSNYEA